MKIQGRGYYKSKPNILYIQVDYLSECKDGIYACDNLYGGSIEAVEEDGYMTFWIEIDMNTYTILDVMTGISVSINSDWVQVDGKFH